MNEVGTPSQWVIKPLMEVATLQRGKDLPESNRTAGDYPVVGSSGVLSYHNEYVAPGPGVLVGRSGSVGRVTWVSSCYWPLNTTLYVSDFHGNEPRYLYYLLNFM